jgi:hypothetical protein
MKQSPEGWYKYKIHQQLDIMFSGKEFDTARYRWLKGNTMTSSHISEMDINELRATYKRLRLLTRGIEPI